MTAPDLSEAVREAIGQETFAKLLAQPLATANGGEEAILKRACAEAQGFPDPLATAVAKFRVLCGSSSTPPKKA